MRNREEKVAENLAIILERGAKAYTESQRKFILRFYVKDEMLYFRRPVFMGWKKIHVEELTIKEFNKLHRLANLSWREQ